MPITPSQKHRLARFLLYLWAAPASAIGCYAAVLALVLGARWRIACGIIEVWGGRLSGLLSLFPQALQFEAITLGHIVIAINLRLLDSHRLHEQVHVCQYERWGILFFPLYLGSSLIALLRGRDPHRCNYFEREAYKNTAPSTIMLDTNNRSFGQVC